MMADTCKWTDNGEFHDTDCGNAFQMYEPLSECPEFKFCPYCGRIIEEVRIEEEEDD